MTHYHLTVSNLFIVCPSINPSDSDHVCLLVHQSIYVFQSFCLPFGWSIHTPSFWHSCFFFFFFCITAPAIHKRPWFMEPIVICNYLKDVIALSLETCVPRLIWGFCIFRSWIWVLFLFVCKWEFLWPLFVAPTPSILNKNKMGNHFWKICIIKH